MAGWRWAGGIAVLGAGVLAGFLSVARLVPHAGRATAPAATRAFALGAAEGAAGALERGVASQSAVLSLALGVSFASDREALASGALRPAAAPELDLRLAADAPLVAAHPAVAEPPLAWGLALAGLLALRARRYSTAPAARPRAQ